MNYQRQTDVRDVNYDTSEESVTFPPLLKEAGKKHEIMTDQPTDKPTNNGRT